MVIIFKIGSKQLINKQLIQTKQLINKTNNSFKKSWYYNVYYYFFNFLYIRILRKVYIQVNLVYKKYRYVCMLTVLVDLYHVKIRQICSQQNKK